VKSGNVRLIPGITLIINYGKKGCFGGLFCVFAQMTKMACFDKKKLQNAEKNRKKQQKFA